jgi:hypothetical protein
MNEFSLNLAKVLVKIKSLPGIGPVDGDIPLASSGFNSPDSVRELGLLSAGAESQSRI